MKQVRPAERAVAVSAMRGGLCRWAMLRSQASRQRPGLRIAAVTRPRRARRPRADPSRLIDRLASAGPD